MNPRRLRFNFRTFSNSRTQEQYEFREGAIWQNQQEDLRQDIQVADTRVVDIQVVGIRAAAMLAAAKAERVPRVRRAALVGRAGGSFSAARKSASSASRKLTA